MEKKQLIPFCYHHRGDKTRFMTHLRPHTSCVDHFSHAPKIGTGKQSACQSVHQVLQEEIGSFGPFALQSAIFFMAVLFLMVSINICRVISTFITQGAFSCWLYLNSKLPLCWQCDQKKHSTWLWLRWWTVMRGCDKFFVEFDWQKFAWIDKLVSFVQPNRDSSQTEKCKTKTSNRVLSSNTKQHAKCYIILQLLAVWWILAFKKTTLCESVPLLNMLIRQRSACLHDAKEFMIVSAPINVVWNCMLYY